MYYTGAITSNFCSTGNAVQTVKSKDSVKLATVRSTAFSKSTTIGGKGAVESFAGMCMIFRCLNSIFTYDTFVICDVC